MKKVLVTAIVLALLFAGLTVMAKIVPTYATLALERGDELPLSGQVAIAAASSWGRYGVFVMVAATLILGAWAWTVGREGVEPDAR